MPRNKVEQTVPVDQYPANRGLDDFQAGQLVFVPRADSERSGYAEASFARIVSTNAYEHRVADQEIDGGMNPSFGFLEVLTTQSNRLPRTGFVGDINHAGIVPIEYSIILGSDQDLQAEWFEGAQWPEDEDWQSYVNLVATSIARFGTAKPSRNGPHNHTAPKQHRPIMFNARLAHGRPEPEPAL